MANVPLFFSHFSTAFQSAAKLYRGLGYAADRSVHCPLYLCPYALLRLSAYLRISGPWTKVPLRENMAPSFDDTEHKETRMPSLSVQSGRHIKRKTPRVLVRI